MSGPDFPEISSVAHSHFEGSQFQRGYHAAQHGDLSVLTRAMGGRSPTELLKQAKRNGKASATDKDKKPAPWITNSRTVMRTHHFAAWKEAYLVAVQMEKVTMLRAQQLVRGTTEFDAAVAVWDWGFKLGGLEADQLFEGCDASPAELQLPDDYATRPYFSYAKQLGKWLGEAELKIKEWSESAAGKLIMEQVEQWFEAWRFGPPGRGASAGNSADVSNGRGSGRSERERVDEEEGGGDSHAATGSERVGRQQEAKRPRTAAQVVVIDDDDEDGEEGEGGEESDAAEDPALDVFADALSMQLERLVSRDDPPSLRSAQVTLSDVEVRSFLIRFWPVDNASLDALLFAKQGIVLSEHGKVFPTFMINGIWPEVLRLHTKDMTVSVGGHDGIRCLGLDATPLAQNMLAALLMDSHEPVTFTMRSATELMALAKQFERRQTGRKGTHRLFEHDPRGPLTRLCEDVVDQLVKEAMSTEADLVAEVEAALRAVASDAARKVVYGHFKKRMIP